MLASGCLKNSAEISSSRTPGRRLPRPFLNLKSNCGKTHFSTKREEHEFTRAVKSLKMCPRFTAGGVLIAPSTQELLAQFNLTGAGAGIGLTGMRERMRELGGRLEIESSGNGTAVRAVIPVAASNAAKKSNRD